MLGIVRWFFYEMVRFFAKFHYPVETSYEDDTSFFHSSKILTFIKNIEPQSYYVLFNLASDGM